MSGINLEAIGDILGSMSPEELEGLSGIAQSLFGGEVTESEKKTDPRPDKKAVPDFDGMDFESISRIMGIMKKLSNRPADPGCELIAALKPLLSPPRRKRADEAISMLRVLSLMPVIGEVMQ